MSETIGDKLKQAREARRLTLDQVTQVTRVRTHYLEALERGDVSAIPSAAQARGFLRIYADFLGLDPNSLAPARPAEPAPASSLDVEAAPSQETLSTPEPARPGLLTSLRQRFARRAPADHAAPVSEPESVAETQPPAPEEFVPVRYTEELPAEPAPVEEPVTTPANGEATPRKAVGRKPASKKIKSSRVVAGRKTKVKKKIAARTST